MIRHYLYKELCLQKHYMKSYILAVSICCAVLAATGKIELVTILAGFIICYTASMGTSYQDDKSRSARFLLSLPVTRRELVRARYMSTLIMMSGIVVVLGAVQLIILAAGHENLIGALVVVYPVSSIVILTAIFYFILFRQGFGRAIQLSRIIYFGIFLGIGSLGFILPRIANSAKVPNITGIEGDALTRLLSETVKPLPVLLVVAISIGIYLLSMAMVGKAFETRDV